MTNSESNTVKIDEYLLKRIELILKNKKLRIHYSCKKQFVNIAVAELLEKLEKGSKA